MGLKESGLRGSLRNVSVGIDAIPDRGAYLDDFANGPTIDTTNDVITDRASYLELSYQEELTEDSTFEEGPENRAEYDILENTNVTIDNGVLNLGSQTGIVASVGRDIVASDQNLRWIVSVDYPDNQPTDEQQTLTLFSETDTYGGATVPNFREGYSVRIDEANDLYRLQEVADDGGTTTLISFSQPSFPALIGVERLSDGSWELFIASDKDTLFDSDNSEGTATDTTHTDVNFVGFGNGSSEEDIEIGFFEIY